MKSLLVRYRTVSAGFLLAAGVLNAADRSTYRSPYSVEFTFKQEELIGDILSGTRANPKDESTIPFTTWYSDSTKKRQGSWGPPAKHYPAPPGLAGKTPEWLRERVIAVALRFAGYSYQHHHIP